MRRDRYGLAAARSEQQSGACSSQPSPVSQAEELERDLFGRDEEAIAGLGAERAGGEALREADTDDEGGDAGSPPPEALPVLEDRTRPAEGRRPVWEDPDDAAARIDVAGRSRLRKLRAAEDESVLTGARAVHSHKP